MGWFAVSEALLTGSGAYGSVRDTLKGEVDPRRSLYIAIREIGSQGRLDAKVKRRIAYWKRHYGLA